MSRTELQIRDSLEKSCSKLLVHGNEKQAAERRWSGNEVNYTLQKTVPLNI